MGVIYASVDVENYTTDHNGTCILSGWRASENPGKIHLQLQADGNEISFSELNFHYREDVFSKCPELDKKDINIGFELAFNELNSLLKQYQDFKLVCTQLDDVEVIWEKSAEELKRDFGNGTLIRKIDSIRSRAGCIVVTGWAIDYLKEDVVRLEDEQGNIIQGECNRRQRPDVCKAYSLDQNYACGFEITILRKDIPGNKIYIHFLNGVADKYYSINLKQFEYENSPRGRLKRTLSLSRRKENLEIIRRYGIKHFVKYVQEQMEGDFLDYEIWRKHHQPSEIELKRQRSHVFEYQPKISIAIPLYNTPLQYLEELVSSIIGQTYGNWELCLADGSTNSDVKKFIHERYAHDRRIHYKKLEANKGIAGNTNEAVDMSTGDFVMLCDHDDLVALNALYEMVSVLNQDSSVDIIYTDEDLVNSDSTEYSSPRFKPDFNIDFLRSINYICHIFMVRKTILDQVGCFREEFDGAQDFDFILRCCEKTEKIHHIPKVLYHWRAHENSTAGNPESKQYAIDAGKRALEQHYKRMEINAKVEYTDIFIMFQSVLKVSGEPRISIIIPSKDHTEDLDKCITSIVEKSTWKNYEIIVVENNSDKKGTFLYYKEIQTRYDNVKVVYWKGAFNYSAINNYGADFASGDYYILLNNDIEVITPGWMELMLGYCQRKDVGIVGAKLYYPDNTVQHCGVVIGVGGFAGHILTQTKREDTGYFGRLKAIQDISAVTAACLMIKRTTFEAVQGLDEEFQVALNDVDLCLKVRELGELIVLNPWVEMYHYESKSRGMEDDPVKHERFKREIARFRDKWNKVIEAGDPYYNKNLTLMYGDCSLRGRHEHFDIVDEITGGK